VGFLVSLHSDHFDLDSRPHLWDCTGPPETLASVWTAQPDSKIVPGSGVARLELVGEVATILGAVAAIVIPWIVDPDPQPGPPTTVASKTTLPSVPLLDGQGYLRPLDLVSTMIEVPSGLSGEPRMRSCRCGRRCAARRGTGSGCRPPNGSGWTSSPICRYRTSCRRPGRRHLYSCR
jgi:hypothetical protein